MQLNHILAPDRWFAEKMASASLFSGNRDIIPSCYEPLAESGTSRLQYSLPRRSVEKRIHKR